METAAEKVKPHLRIGLKFSRLKSGRDAGMLPIMEGKPPISPVRRSAGPFDPEVPERVTLRVPPDQAHDPVRLHRRLADALTCNTDALPPHRILRRSIDARRGRPCYEITVALGAAAAAPSPPPLKPLSADAKPVIVVGAGPAGYFAALELIEHGLRPILLERGPDVTARRYAIAGLHRCGRVDAEANYCFGEGGAGAYSDGKLYTRATKRGDVGKVLQRLVECGADPEVLVDAHPHIGSNRLPRIIARLRQAILDAGGQVHFGCRVTGLLRCGDRICGVVSARGEPWHGEAVILATGHSARDVYTWLLACGVKLVAKPMAVGVRIEHPQSLIDQIQYRCPARPAGLPPATYRLKTRVDGRAVYSFCMCPGGHVIPASTAPGELVLNGMSMAGRNGPLANAGLVVEVGPGDLSAGATDDPLAMLKFQQSIEAAAFAAGRGLEAPAQRMTDFVAGRLSRTLPASSYRPGLVPWPVHHLLPPSVAVRLQAAMTAFGRRLKGFLTEEALVLAVESRTSAPVCVLRDDRTLMAPGFEGLYPCGEGAGHAGGIVSAALDGQNVARCIARRFGRV
jgi:uncharacterized protein